MPMEFGVSEQKNHVHTMTASRHDDNIIERGTKALHGMHSVCENVHKVSNVFYRT